MPMPNDRSLPLIFDSQNYRFWIGKREVKLTSTTLSLLLCLIRNRNRFVDKHELLDRLWPDDDTNELVVRDNIRELRAALGDDARQPRWIKTQYRHGYRFIGSLRFIQDSLPDLTFGVQCVVRVETLQPLDGSSAAAMIARSIAQSCRLALYQTPGVSVTGICTERSTDAADFAVVGTIRLSSSTWTVLVEIDDTRSGHCLWVRDYQISVGDLESAIEAIAWAVATEIDVRNGGGQWGRLWREQTRDAKAYSELRSGLYWLETYDRNGFQRAEQHFETALALDPRFATALTSLSMVHLTQLSLGITRSSRLVSEQLNACSNRAKAISRECADWYQFMGWIALRYNNPHAPPPGVVDPFASMPVDNLDLLISHVMHLCFLDRLHEAKRISETQISGFPGIFPSVSFASGLVALLEGDFSHAAQRLEIAAGDAKSGAKPRIRSMLAYAYAKSGQPRRADQNIQVLLRIDPNWSRARLEWSLPFVDRTRLRKIADTLQQHGLPDTQ